MRVLVIGNGGREHAIAHALLQSPQVARVLCIPGNGGTALMERCDNLSFQAGDFEGVARVALAQGVGLVVIGPEAPLAAGLADALRSQGIRVFGPGKDGAQLEASKSWAKELMREAGIPTAAAATFGDADAAIAYIREQGAPIVVKADGLAAGKGVTVATTVAEAIAAVEAALGGVFGAAGSRVVIEECLQGQEASVLAVTDGKTIRPLVPAQDHKRIGEGDTGPNTGGMGAYAPAPLVTPALMDRIQSEILEPVLATLRDRGIDYCGVIYAGLMITPEGDPKTIEFNCRFGDPETQVVLPLLETPLIDVLLACTEGRLADLPPLVWRSQVAACVVGAAQGYPGNYAKGIPLTDLDRATEFGATVIHAGTQVRSQHTRTGVIPEVSSTGGRVLAVTALGDTFDDAFGTAYQAMAAIAPPDLYYRRDIGYQVRSSTTLEFDHAGVAESN